MNNNKSYFTGPSSDLTDPQIRLAKAFENRDIEEFRCALTVGGNPLAIDDQYFNIFERALQTPGAVEFVSECLQAGCDPNHINNYYNKAAINYATDSRDPAILKTLLSKPGVQVNYIYASLTPLNSLAKNLTTDYFDDCVECMKILLAHDALINKPDQQELTPLHNIVKNRKITDAQKYRLVQMFSKLPNIDIDTYREGELRRTLETLYPLLELPAKSQCAKITFHTLLKYMRQDDMKTFVEQYNDEKRYTSREEDLELLVESIERGAHEAFDLLMEMGVDYNRIVRSNSTPIQIAWVYGNWYALEKLLKQSNIIIRSKDQPLSHIVCKLSEGYRQKFCDYWKCFIVLLDSDKIDINATDYSKSTALHYAVQYHNKRAIRELLKRGAGICIENVFHELPLHGMSPFILEEHLDDCVTSNDEKYGDKDYEIIINFQNFMLSTQSSEKQLNAVLKPISFMAKSKEYRHLLQHPVITSILYLKWHKLSLIFYINFLLYLFFAVSMVSYCVLSYRATEAEYSVMREVTQYCSWLGICYLIAREFLQLVLSPVNYLFTISNYIEIGLIGCSLVTSCNEMLMLEKDTQLNIAVACILLLAYELVLLIGSLPVSSISTHILMLETVCKSFVKIFLLYSIFIVTFTLCFYIKSDSAVGDKDEFHVFPNPMLAFAKILVMFTGEFDAGSMKLDSNYMLFLFFVFFMAIILFNLLNGLAVSDTQAIKNQAELNEIICRINLLSRYEKTVFKQTGCSSFFTKRQPFHFMCYVFKKLFPTYTTDVQISIRPNDKNRIKTSKTKPKEKTVKIQNLLNDSGNDNDQQAEITFLDEIDATEDQYFSDQNKLLLLYYWIIMKIFSRIDQRTVAQAMAVLEKKLIPTIEGRLEGMEDKLNKILKALEVQGSQGSLCF